MSADYEWDLTMMYLIHRALRRDLKAFAVTLRDPNDPLRDDLLRDGFAYRWSFFSRTLHHHHSGEDAVIWPYMRAARPDTRELMDAMEAEHSLLEPLMNAVQSGVGRLEATTKDQRRALADQVDALGQVLGDHLDHEERDALPLLTFTIDEKTAKRFERHQQRSMKFSEAAVFFPWLTVDATVAESDVAWANLPTPVRRIVRSRWTRQYDRANARTFPTLG